MKKENKEREKEEIKERGREGVVEYPSRNILIKIETNQNEIAGINFLEQLDTFVYVSLSYTKAKISCKNEYNQKLKQLRTLNCDCLCTNDAF
jgi:hypothetical protein